MKYKYIIIVILILIIFYLWVRKEGLSAAEVDLMSRGWNLTPVPIGKGKALYEPSIYGLYSLEHANVGSFN
ncbi:MAG: hypothetical protein QW303_07920 [Nitrososphaerota archaeon]